MALLTSNNVKKVLALAVAPADTTITLADTLGIPDVSGAGDYTILTLVRLSDSSIEIVQVDDIVGNVLTIQRAQEGTSALSFALLDEVRNYFTSGMFQLLSAQTNRTAAELAETNAAADALLAEKYANEVEDVVVEAGPNRYSAFHWSEKAAAQAAAFQPGTLVESSGVPAVSGYLYCNGATVNRTTYADLFAAIGDTYGVGDGVTTFEIPDYRGVFLRGWDDGRGLDTGRVFGNSYQTDLVGTHDHSTQVGANGGAGSTYPSAAALIDSLTPGVNTGFSGGVETRPKNYTVKIHIKY